MPYKYVSSKKITNYPKTHRKQLISLTFML